MTVHLEDDRVFRVWWRYSRKQGPDEAEHRRNTSCFLLQVILNVEAQAQDYDIVADITLHKLDRFRAEKGRKLSLAKALKSGGFDKTDRTAFWEAYHNRGTRGLDKALAPCYNQGARQG